LLTSGQEYNLMQNKIFIARDFTAQAMGAERVVNALVNEADSRGIAVEIVRTGSLGMYWLEPMICIELGGQRIAYGPVSEDDVAGLFDADFCSGGKHDLLIGQLDKIDYLMKQERLVFARSGINDPLSLADYESTSGFNGLRRALELAPDRIVDQIMQSGLRGRGGAAFPTGIKWKTVMETQASQKYIVCNADEGDSGTYSDRMIMEGDPCLMIEGMIIAGIGVGATMGYIYLRCEYPLAANVLQQAITLAYEGGYLGRDILGSGKQFDLELRIGAGAYICGEETSLLESLEGKRGEIRFKPPLPAIKGLFGMPTLVNNVITLASVPIILDKGAEFYKDYGMGKSRGTLPFQLAGNIKYGGLVEKAFGLSLNEILYDFGGGSATGRPIRAVQVGGPLGAYLPESQFDTPLDYEAFSNIGAMLGHGGIVVFDDTVDMAEMARYAMEFCAIESCGKCTPCRIGSTRGVEVINRIIKGTDRVNDFNLLNDLCDTMINASLCALGGLTPYPVMSAIKYFPEDFQGVKTTTSSAMS
jgi:formate dehydrogenase iron-sulfur subunit